MTVDWRDIGDKHTEKDKPLPKTEANFDRVILMRDELIGEQRAEISKLKSRINRLEQKLTKKELSNG